MSSIALMLLLGFGWPAIAGVIDAFYELKHKKHLIGQTRALAIGVIILTPFIVEPFITLYQIYRK